MKKRYLLIAILLFSISLSHSQQCAFDVNRSELRKNPSYVALEKAAEQKIQQTIKKRKTAAKSSSSTILNIPVVVHVLHLGETLGTGSNISDAQIQSSINNLNDFYRGQTANSATDFQIEFALAQRDPDCNSSTGINRINASGLTGYSSNGVNVNNSNGASYTDIKNLISWPQTDYFNIWIVTELDNNGGGSGFQGYAYFYSESSNNHGSVMMSSVFGYDPGNTNGWGLNSNGDNSTVVHEVGHYFHLYHTFQGDDANSDGVSDRCPNDTGIGDQSDGCADTETHQRQTSTCPTTNTCSGVDWLNNNTINNIMSYYNCTDRMTANQKTRARAAMEGTSIVKSRGSNEPDSNYAAPTAVCATNSTSTNSAGIISVELNNITFTSFSSASDGGNIDKSANCSNYFEIDVSEVNTLNVGMFTVNTHQLGVWIDWNDDGDFDDDAEQQYAVTQGISANSTVPIVLTYPATIPYNDYVRVRLITDLTAGNYGSFTVNPISSACHSSLVRGQSEDYAIYVKPLLATWTGNVDINWATAANWSTNNTPTLNNDVTIPSAPSNQPIIGATTGATVNNLTIEGSLSITNAGSLKVAGTSTGNITYNLAIPDANWHLVSSPVVSEQYDNDWITANAIASGSGNNRAISTYNNGTPDTDTDGEGPDTATQYWRYFQANGASTTFNSGVGYSNKRTALGNYSFTGTFPTSAITPAISQNNNNWNLLGNPYPSYIDVDAFLTANTVKLAGAFQAIYVWNGATYTNLTSGYIQPGQGFFVHSNIASGTLSFTEVMQSHQTGITFYKNNFPDILLSLSNGKSTKTTEIAYQEGKTLGLDPRFDVGLFDGVSADLKIFTHLVEDNENIAFQKQTLPLANMESIVVPVGIKANADIDLTFSIEAKNLPTGVKVFLEDRLMEKFMLLDANTNYKINLSNAENGTGRFYIHTTSSALSTSEFNTLIRIFKKDASTLRIVGVQGNSKVKLFDVQGKQILNTSFYSENTYDIRLPKVAAGIYIVELITENTTLKKKFILE